MEAEAASKRSSIIKEKADRNPVIFTKTVEQAGPSTEENGDDFYEISVNDAKLRQALLREEV